MNKIPEQKINIKKMAELLKAGHSMLNQACPICNSPIFRNKEGELFCPSCNRKVIIVKDAKSFKEQSKIIKSQEKKIQENFNEKELGRDFIEIYTKLKRILVEKLEEISLKLEKETQISLLNEYLFTINKILKIIKKL